LQASPEKLWIYGSIVEILLSRGGSKDEWASILKEMESAIRNSSGKSSGEDPGLSSVSPDSVYGTSTTFKALAQAAEEAGKHGKAWTYYKALNAYQKRKVRPFSAAFALEQHESLITIFDKSFWESGTEVGVDSTVPIFIVGMPYSGAKLIEKILDGHSKIFGLNAQPKYYETVMDKMGVGLRAGFFGSRMEQFTLAVSRARSAITAEYGIEEVSRLAEQNVLDMKAVMHAITGIDTIGHYVDTDLDNYRLIGLIHYVFPKAVIINMVRDPLDTILDCYRNRRGEADEKPWTLDLNHLTAHYVRYLRLMAHWRHVLPGRVLDVHSEALLLDPERALEPVLSALGLEWESSMSEMMGVAGVQEWEGAWQRFPEAAKEVRGRLSGDLSGLRDEGSLPFSEEVNWSMSTKHKYRYKPKGRTSDKSADPAVPSSRSGEGSSKEQSGGKQKKSRGKSSVEGSSVTDKQSRKKEEVPCRRQG